MSLALVSSISSNGDLHAQALPQLLSQCCTDGASGAGAGRDASMDAFVDVLKEKAGAHLPTLWSAVNSYQQDALALLLTSSQQGLPAASPKKPIWLALTTGDVKKPVWKGSASERWLLQTLHIHPAVLTTDLQPHAAAMPAMTLLEPTLALGGDSAGGAAFSSAAASASDGGDLSDFGFAPSAKPTGSGATENSAPASAPASTLAHEPFGNGFLDFSLFEASFSDTKPPAHSTPASSAKSPFSSASSASSSASSAAAAASSSLAFMDDELLGFSLSPGASSAPTSSLSPTPASPFALSIINASTSTKKLSDEAMLLLDGLPDLSYMHSVVLMFPANLSSKEDLL